MISEFEF